ncbi:hypothetical protein ACWEVD_25890 [Nocardia thailandica]
MSTLDQRRIDRAARASLAGTAGFIAFWAYAGAIGLIGGGADLGPDITGRLPLHSQTVAGLLLMLVVAAPMTVTTVTAMRGDHACVRAGWVSGILLIGWVAVQPLIIGAFHWLQPIFGVLGLAVCLLAGRYRHVSG